MRRRLWGWSLSALLLPATVLLAAGCLPCRSTRLRPLHRDVRPVGGTPRGAVMVATLVPRGHVVTRNLEGLAVGPPRDGQGRDLARAVKKLRVARRVLPSPLTRASHAELLAAARAARAALLLTSQVVSVRLTRGPNARFAGLLACALTVGMTLVALPACMAIPAHSLEAEVELELAIWDVRQRRRLWQRRVRRKGWLAVSSYAAGRAVERAIARGTNAAYRAALPGLLRGLTGAGRLQNSGVKR